MKDRLGVLASIAAIIGVCIAIIALIPAFGQWLAPISQEKNNQQPLLQPIIAEEEFKRSLFLLPDCGYDQSVDSNVQTEIQYGSWAARTLDILEENLKHISITISLDGRQFDGSLNQLRFPVSDLPCRKDLAEGYWTYYSVVATGFSPGNHIIKVTYTIDAIISDGYDLDRDGIADVYSGKITRTYNINSK